MENTLKGLPWEVVENDDIEIMDEFGIFTIATMGMDYDETESIRAADCIASAINNTYHKGINPSAIPDIYKALVDLHNCVDIEGVASEAVMQQAVAAIKKAKTF